MDKIIVSHINGGRRFSSWHYLHECHSNRPSLLSSSLQFRNRNIGQLTRLCAKVWCLQASGKLKKGNDGMGVDVIGVEWWIGEIGCPFLGYAIRSCLP